MNLEFFTSNRLTPTLLIPEILKEHRSYYEYEAFKQYYTQYHNVNSKVKRKMREVTLPTGLKDQEGNDIMRTEYVDVNRLSIPFQKIIVSRKTAFTTGGGLTLKCKPEGQIQKSLFDALLTSWSKNKLDFRNQDIFRRLASETEVCEVWHTSKPGADGKPKASVNIYSPSMGFDLIPVFDEHSDLIAFGLKYSAEEKQHLTVYDKDNITKYVMKTGSIWLVDGEPIKHGYGKIPVIYYSIYQAIWQDVQQEIDRYETLISNHADTNDANAHPILFASGVVEGFSERGERGKFVESENGAKLEYVTWDNAPQSLKLELENLKDIIFTMTQTPDISFQSMAKIGGDVSGVAWDRMMIDPHLSAIDYHNGVYGEGIQRRINLLLYMLSTIQPALSTAKDMEVTPKFNLFKINSESERIDLAMKATGGLPLMTQKEGIQYVGLSDDPEQTFNELNNEETE